MRNHQSRPTGSKPLPEVNMILPQTCGCGRGHRRDFQYHGTHGSNHSNYQKKENLMEPLEVELY